LALAGTFYSHQIGYGSGDSAVEQYKYVPALQSQTGQQIILQSLIGSRQGGKRYTGNVSEYGILETAANGIGGGLGGVKVSDAIKLAGIDGKIDEQYRDMYLSDLAKKDKELFKAIVGKYNQNLADMTVAEALTLRVRDKENSGLEKIFEKPKK
jgi:hypothetical protein